MKIAKRSAGSDEFVAGLSSGVTADTYAARCSAFIKSRGDKGFVIRAIEGQDGSLATKRAATEAQWTAWMYYFAWREIPHRYAEARGMTTVPCEWPEDFDRESLSSERNAQLPGPRPLASPEQRKEIARQMRALGARLAARDHRKQRTDAGAMSQVEAERHLSELEARFRVEKCAPLSSLPAPKQEVTA